MSDDCRKKAKQSKKCSRKRRNDLSGRVEKNVKSDSPAADASFFCGERKKIKSSSRRLASSEPQLKDGICSSHPLLGEDVPGVSARAGREVADEAHELGLGGGHGRDVVWEVVAVIAGEGLAARQRRLGVLGVQLLDAVVVVRGDDRRDVEVVEARPAVPADLAQHALSWVRLALAHCVPVAHPPLREVGRHSLAARERDRVELRRADLGDEVDVAVDGVLGHHVDRVGGCDGCESSKCEGLVELHGDCRLVFEKIGRFITCVLLL